MTSLDQGKAVVEPTWTPRRRFTRESSPGKTYRAVNTAEEKRLIGDIAINTERLENVSNQLEVN